MKLEKIYIVEGAHDASKLKQFDPNINVLYTGGIRIKKEFIERLKKLEKTHQIILLLDPDFAGEKIREKLNENLVKATNIFIKKELATSENGSIGLEHVKKEYLSEILKYEHITAQQGDIDNKYLLLKGYLGKPYSKKLRLALCDYYHIGYVNGKGLAKRLNLYNITREKISNYEIKEKIRSTLFDK